MNNYWERSRFLQILISLEGKKINRKKNWEIVLNTRNFILSAFDAKFELEETRKLPLSLISVQWRVSYRNQTFDLQCISNYWFLYETQNWTEMGFKSFEVSDQEFSLFSFFSDSRSCVVIDAKSQENISLGGL